MAIVAVAKGGFQYVLLDLIVVLVAYAYAFDRWCMGSPPTTDVPSTNIQSVPPIQSDGDVAQWHENGKKEIEGNYVNDENEDLWPDEDPLIDEDPLTDEDLLTDEDPLACWYENGQKQVEDKFVNGEMVSTTCWYENGQKQAEGHYVNGKPDGIANEWYKNGQKKTEQKFVNGELVLTTWWNKNGQKNAECNHLKGKVVPGSYKEWDENGNLKR